jgi:hypothetical protein
VPTRRAAAVAPAAGRFSSVTLTFGAGQQAALHARLQLAPSASRSATRSRRMSASALASGGIMLRTTGDGPVHLQAALGRRQVAQLQQLATARRAR